MRISKRWWLLLPGVIALGFPGCSDASGPEGPGQTPDDPDVEDLVSITGTVTTSLGDRVDGVSVHLWGVTGSDPESMVYELLDQDLTDPTGEFSVFHSPCSDYSTHFIDLEIACFPIGYREVECGTHKMNFVWGSGQ